MLTGNLCAAQEPAPPAADARGDQVYKLIGAGLALRYEAAACGVVPTSEQRRSITAKLDALIKEAGSSPAEVGAFKARIKSKIDPLIEANANFCTTIVRSFPSYVRSFAAERPTADWEDAAESETGGSTTTVSGWTVDSHDCTITLAYRDKDDGNVISGVFVGKVEGAIAVTLQHESWAWGKDALVPARTTFNETAVTPLVDWHATKPGPFLAAVFPVTALPDVAKATEITLAFDRREVGDTTFHVAGMAEALGALTACGL